MRGFARSSLKLVNFILTRATLLLLLFLFSTSLYSLWDNHRIYESVDDVLSELYKWRPTQVVDSGDGSGERIVLDFSALQEINPDICAWLTVEGTNIDHPIVQGENNETYLNRDVYGEFSLAGSIYLDSRNSPDFSDAGNLIYGHHMDRHLMFGDLDLFLDKEFFEEDRSITLMTADGTHDLTPLAVMQIPASDQTIFDLPEWDGDVESLLALIREQGIQVDDYTMEIVSDDPTVIQIVVLVTCASGHTNTRTILITVMPKEEVGPVVPDDPDDPGDIVLPAEPNDPDQPDNPGEGNGDVQVPDPDNPIIDNPPDVTPSPGPGDEEDYDDLDDPDVPNGGLHPENSPAPGEEDELDDLDDPDVPNGGLHPEDEWNAPAKTGDPFYHSVLFWAFMLVVADAVLAVTILADLKKRPKRNRHR